MKRLLLLLAIPSLILSACKQEDSDDVNQDKIYTDYEVFYNANDDKTVVIAKFRFGDAFGTILELTGSAGVTYNGDELLYNGFYGGHTKEYAGENLGGQFVYTNTEGNTFSNTALATSTIGFPASFTSLSKSAAYDLQWTGTTTATNERVALFIGSYTWGQDAFLLQTQTGANNIIIGVNNMSNLAEGSSTCYMDRVTETNASQVTGNGGMIRTRYRGTNASITVNP